MLTTLIRKLTPYVAATAIALSGGCKKEHDVRTVSDEKTSEIVLEKIVKFEKTDSQGQLTFIEQSGEVVDVTVINESDKPVSGAEVVFFDGNGFKAYMVNHPDLTPEIPIYDHNSKKVFRLTKSPLQVKHYTGSTNENSTKAAQGFVDTLKLTKRHYAECITAEDAKFRAKEENNIFDFMGTIPGAGQVVTATQKVTKTYYKVIETLVNSGILKGGECAAFQKWYIVPPTEDKGNIRSVLWYWECIPSIPAEVCGDGIDNDCDGKIDGKDSDCIVTDSQEKKGSVTIEETIRRIFSCEPENFEFTLRHIYLPRFHEQYSGDELEKKMAEFVKDYMGLPPYTSYHNFPTKKEDLKKKWHGFFVGYDFNVLTHTIENDCYLHSYIHSSKRKVEITRVVVGNPKVSDKSLDELKPRFSKVKEHYTQELFGPKFVPATRSVTEALVSYKIHDEPITQTYKYFLLFVDLGDGQPLFLDGLQVDYDRTVK
ncbi:hypothetical protein HOL21_01165 [Candidatus Woesearchaeota archaeon]|jgi:hypothetical protein|nr:hypothetical protein [Candidatus Woesearchaeota archaeon]MBT5396804.1 hypothetical protein [Candidatus Woesearchaeota archaeon]MBT6367692.1 hypothetical protein [Candidatus Woesearchaeota archaeon]MBT7762907.1 hypothetical protein [Candidatus Woesearchaeota archaeon]